MIKMYDFFKVNLVCKVAIKNLKENVKRVCRNNFERANGIYLLTITIRKKRLISLQKLWMSISQIYNEWYMRHVLKLRY